ncbi:MAG: hypothetical protein M1827_007512 [Pycnora praestabilis]|nr:MAG: hypothetical protein M1827_007512 [Pycnora praestabilis]
MDSIKNAIGLGGNQQVEKSGREPVSGQTGSGTVSEPFDTGNTQDSGELGGTAGPGIQSGSDTGPSPYMPFLDNDGPHKTSLANKLDPMVDSDNDRKPNSGPRDRETLSEGVGSQTVGGVDDSSNVSTANTTGGSTTERLDATAQGMNVVGGLRPEQNPDNTGVTGSRHNDAKASDQRPTQARGSLVETRGQDRGAISGAGAGAVEPSVGANPSSGQTPKQKQQGGDKPLEEPSGK